jgi:hypothetical protein
MAFVTIPALMAPILGPPLGGLIVTYAAWQWIFLINLPFGVLGFVLVSRYIGDVRGGLRAPLDLAGWWLLGGGLGGLVFALESLGKHVVAPQVTALSLTIGILLLILYWRHARTDEAPLLRLSLLNVPTFRASVTGGTLYRIGVGGSTLLLPMMLQLGYGLSALHSGLLTFSAAVGAMGMKTLAPALTRRYGFRRILVHNTVVCAAALVLSGWLSPDWPIALALGFLVLSGFLRSLQFTCVNALAFSDIAERDMSQATSASSTAQQLGLSLGVGAASQLLNLSLAVRGGHALTAHDFTLAFAGVGLITLLSLWSFQALEPEAGQSVSGHRLAMANAPTATVGD